MKYFLILLLAFPALTSAQDKLPFREGRVHYEFVDSFPGQSKDALFNKVSIWASGGFRDAKEANELVDAENGEYIARGSTVIEGALNDARYFFTLRVSVRDGKARVSIYNIDFINSIAPNVLMKAEDIKGKKYIKKLNDKMTHVAFTVFTNLKANPSDDF